MKLSEFDYKLPPELIAQRAKDRSRMMVLDQGIEDKMFSDILDHVQKDDVIVINDTRVRKVLVEGQKESGSRVVFTSLEQLGDLTYKGFIRGRNPKVGTRLIFQGCEARIIESDKNIFTLEFDSSPDFELPRPPYIKEKVHEEEYQTVYATKEGSLAAPTAGLHFTEEIIASLENKGAVFARVCLHVGLGTFSPVAEDIEKHEMHEEDVLIDEENARLINQRKGRLFIVGTTTMKALETAADEKGRVHPYCGSSDLFIYPGYDFKVSPYGFLTNFHLPMSSLLLLVSAYYGKEVLQLG